VSRRWGREIKEGARFGQKVIARIFSIYTSFEGMAYERDGRLRERQGIASSNL
jgi:hypothetical protein